MKVTDEPGGVSSHSSTGHYRYAVRAGSAFLTLKASTRSKLNDVGSNTSAGAQTGGVKCEIECDTFVFSDTDLNPQKPISKLSCSADTTGEGTKHPAEQGKGREFGPKTSSASAIAAYQTPVESGLASDSSASRRTLQACAHLIAIFLLAFSTAWYFDLNQAVLYGNQNVAVDFQPAISTAVAAMNPVEPPRLRIDEPGFEPNVVALSIGEPGAAQTSLGRSSFHAATSSLPLKESQTDMSEPKLVPSVAEAPTVQSSSKPATLPELPLPLVRGSSTPSASPDAVHKTQEIIVAPAALLTESAASGELRSAKTSMSDVSHSFRIDDERLLSRAEVLLSAGDITGARLLLSRAMEGGSARAARRLAQTYDPGVLSSWRVRGIRGDEARARDLYVRAQAIEKAGHP